MSYLVNRLYALRQGHLGVSVVTCYRDTGTGLTLQRLKSPGFARKSIRYVRVMIAFTGI